MKSKIKEQTALEQTLAFIQVDPSLDSSRLRSFCLHNSVPHSAADQSQHRRYLPSDQSEARDFRTKLSKPNCCLKAASSIISQEREKNRLTSPRVRLGMKTVALCTLFYGRSYLPTCYLAVQIETTFRAGFLSFPASLSLSLFCDKGPLGLSCKLTELLQGHEYII